MIFLGMQAKLFFTETMEPDLLVCLFICICLLLIILSVVCEYFISPTVWPLNVDRIRVYTTTTII